MTGYITKNAWEYDFAIQVEGYPKISYMDYSVREAIKRYREKFGLKHKRIYFIQMDVK